jgi:hypothetical protein
MNSILSLTLLSLPTTNVSHSDYLQTRAPQSDPAESEILTL